MGQLSREEFARAARQAAQSAPPGLTNEQFRTFVLDAVTRGVTPPSTTEATPQMQGAEAYTAEMVPNSTAADTPEDRERGLATIGEIVEDANPGALERFGTGFWKNTNPMGLVHMAGDLVGTGRGMLEAQGQLGVDAYEEFQAGNYPRAARKAVNYVLPVLGPGIDSAADQAEQGNYAGALGEIVGLGAVTAGPVGLVKARAARPGARGRRPPTQHRQVDEAVQFAEDRGIPIEAATASNSRVLNTLQRRSQDSMGGAGVAERFQGRQNYALERVGGNLAEESGAAGLSPEAAGNAIRNTLGESAAGYHASADASYTTLSNLESQAQGVIDRTGGVRASGATGRPFTQVPLEVNITEAQNALRATYDEMMRARLIAAPIGAEAKGLQAMDRLMQHEGVAPLSVVDRALSHLKALQRSAPNGAAIGEVVGRLHEQVSAAARRGGAQVVEALETGRRNVKAEHAVLDTLKKVREEPVQAFEQATFRGDRNINQLRQIAREAPQELKQAGRTWLEEQVALATEEGGFGHGARLYRSWRNLGPETKRLLFRDEAHIKALDNYFLLAKKIAENKSVVETSRSIEILNVGTVPLTYVISRLMHSPLGVRLATRRLQTPQQNTAALNAWRSEVASLFEREGVPQTADINLTIRAPEEEQ